MVFLYEHQDVINVDFDLIQQFYFEYDIVRNINAVTLFTFLLPFVLQILINTQVILKVSVA